MTDTVEDTPVVTEEVAVVDDSQTVADMVNETPPETETSDRPEWLLNKYAVEGKSIEEATSEQAKAYNELSGKFGAFTGAPESYEVSLSDELKEAGIEIGADDPMVEAAMAFAKESNMDQAGFEGMVNLYAMQQLAENNANADYKAEQMKALGTNAESRINNITQWANKNLDAETVQGLEGMATSAESVKAIERLISLSRNGAVNVDNAAPATSVTAEDVSKMQFEKDSNGNRRINTDPEFAARFKKLQQQVYGTEEFKQMVG